MHLSEWPEVKKTILDKFKDKNEIIDLMEKAREIVSRGLETRVAEGVKVRQPLAAAYILGDLLNISNNKEVVEIIKEELNVKEIHFAKDKKDAISKNIFPADILENIPEEKSELSVFLNTTLDEELKKEGNFREFLRAVQSLRKKKKLQVSDVVELKISVDKDKRDFIEDNMEELQKVAGVKAVHYNEVDGGDTVNINGIDVKIMVVNV